MCKDVFYNNKDKINSNKKSIKKHTLIIKKLINVLSTQLNVNQNLVLNDLEPYMNKSPQNRPIGSSRSSLDKFFALPKFLINKPTIEYEKESSVLVFSFPVVSFTPGVNGNKTTLLSEYTKYGTNHNLSLYQLNIVYKTKSGNYSISIHQNCFERGIRQPVFLGRFELGDTHNTRHERVGSTFHIHMPYDSNIDLKFQNTLLSAIYHCQPEVYSGQTDVSLNSALDIAMKKFNIRNDYDSAIDFKNHSVLKFLDSSCGRDWSDKLLDQPKRTISFNTVYETLETHKTTPPKQNAIMDFINSRI